MSIRPRRIIVYVWLLVLAVALGLAWRTYKGPDAGTPGAGIGVTIGGPFAMVDHTGRAVTEADFRGRYTLVFFGYTYCSDVCPTTLSDMADALEALGAEGVKVQPIFVTIDPQRDTPEQLAMYVRHFHPRLVGLTGSAEQVATMAKAYRVYYARARSQGDQAEPDDYIMDHTAIAYLMGPDGAFRAQFGHGVGAETMARRIREFL